MKIYVLKTDELFDKIEGFNGFTASEWNDLNELPETALKLLKKAKIKDMVYTPHNFVLDFNLEDDLTDHKKYTLFIPDEKFKKQMEDFGINF